MTTTQSNAVQRAISAAHHAVGVIEHDGHLIISDPAKLLMVVAIASAQMAAAREVAQWSANDRADLARMDLDEISKAITSRARP